MATRRKKIAIGVSVPLVLLLGAFGGIYYSVAGGMKKLEAGQALVDPHAHLVKDGMAAAYVLEVGDGTVVLVDAGNDPQGVAILAELAALHVDRAHVRAVLLTHGHHDHTAALHVLPGVEICALPADAGLVAGTSGGHGPLTRLFGASPTGLRVTHPLHDGETLHFGDLAVDVFAIPGHTAGSAAYLARGVVYFGDSAGSRADGESITPGPWVFDDDQDQNRASLRALAARLAPRRGDVRGLAFGHTAPLASGDALFAFR